MIYTSYFGNWRKFPKDTRLVSVARGIPRNTKGMELCSFSSVRPSHHLLSDFKNGRINELIYTDRYLAQLANLSLKDFVEEYDESFLLCYEKTGDFCHRHILAWLINRGPEGQLVKEFAI